MPVHKQRFLRQLLGDGPLSADDDAVFMPLPSVPCDSATLRSGGDGQAQPLATHECTSSTSDGFADSADVASAFAASAHAQGTVETRKRSSVSQSTDSAENMVKRARTSLSVPAADMVDGHQHLLEPCPQPSLHPLCDAADTLCATPTAALASTTAAMMRDDTPVAASRLAGTHHDHTLIGAATTLNTVTGASHDAHVAVPVSGGGETVEKMDVVEGGKRQVRDRRKKDQRRFWVEQHLNGSM